MQAKTHSLTMRAAAKGLSLITLLIAAPPWTTIGQTQTNTSQEDRPNPQSIETNR